MYMCIWDGCSGGWNPSEHLEQPPTNLGKIYKECVVGAKIQSTPSNCSYLMFGRISFKMRWRLLAKELLEVNYGDSLEQHCSFCGTAISVKAVVGKVKGRLRCEH